MGSLSTAEPSLSSRAMLCSLSISVWSARKHDVEASEEIARQHGAQADVGRYYKTLLPKAALAEIQQIVSDARQQHYFMTLPWDDNGYRVLPAAAPSDYRWTPPNRRYIASGLYLSSVERQGVGEIVIAVDTSGSIGRLELEQFAGEISAIAVEVQPEAIHVVYCDAAVQAVQHFGPSEPVRLEPKGGGGTDFRPAFEWVAENAITPACFIYLTDLCCDSYPEAPEYPVLWVTDSRRTAPFGETIRIATE